MIQTFRRSVSPLLVLVLTVLWLLLNQTISPGHVVLGVLLGVMVAWAGSTLRPVRSRVRRIDAAVELACIVLFDIVRSNIGVARIVLGLVRKRKISAGFLDIPLDMRDPHGLATLAMIVTSTPGTVWVGLNSDTNVLRLHVLDLTDEAYWIDLIKNRYERRLMRIFQ